MSESRSTNPSAPGKPSRARKRSKPATAASVGADIPAAEPVASPDPAVTISFSMGDRESMIRTAAYYRAQRRNFESGHALEDWLAAEAEIDAAMTQGGLRS